MSENEYKRLVFEDFDQKIQAQQLPSELISPTPGSLKAESVKICDDRFDSKDGIILGSFFGTKEDAYAYRQAIQNSNVDVFRPLINLLKNRSINTSLKNINLLAWLIDFQPRPYHPNLTFQTKSNIPDSLFSQPPTQTDSETKPVSLIPLLKQPIVGKKKLIIACVLLMVIALTGYFVIDRKAHVITGHVGCMFWQDSHYQPIACSKNFFHFHVIPINYKLINEFKRITLPDTLTLRSVGKVWYAKFRGRIEFYTKGGTHPIDTNRRLLPMSDHILKKYVYHMIN